MALGFASIVLIISFKGQTEHLIPLYAVADQLWVSPNEPTMAIEGNVIIIPVAGITRVVENSLNYAKSLSANNIIAVYVSFEREDEKKFEEKWNTGIRLVTLLSLHRSLVLPLTKFIDTIEHKANETNYQVTVLIPEFIPKQGWHNILHNQSSLLIRAYLLYRRNVVITTVPYHLKK